MPAPAHIGNNFLGHYQTIFYALLLAALTVGIYAQIRNYPFHDLDDPAYVTKNSRVQAGITWETFKWAWTSTEAANWHPLTWLSHELDVELFGLNAGDHYLVSLGIHVLNALLLFFLLLKVTEKRTRSFLVAALFALHPYNVESVAWISERKNVLSTLLFLLTLAAYGWYARNPRVKRYLVVLVSFALALSAKPMVITLPFVLLLLDFWPLQRVQIHESQPSGKKNKRRDRDRKLSLHDDARSGIRFPQFTFGRLLLEKAPLLALSALSAIITLIAQQAGGAVQALTNLPLGMRIENALWSYAIYLFQAFWPARLAVYYPFSHSGPALWKVSLALVLLAGISLWVWQKRFSQRYLLVGWLWYLGTLVPVIGIIQVGEQAHADRYMYLPLIGIFVMAVWAIADLAKEKQIHASFPAAISAAIIAALCLITYRQVGYWRSDYDLWSRAVAVTSDNFVAQVNLADTLRKMNRPQEALAHFQTAAGLRPEDPLIHVDLAAGSAAAGDIQAAIEEYRKAISLSSQAAVIAPSYESLAALYSSLGDFQDVETSYEHALAVEPGIAPYMIDHLSQGVANNPTAGGYLSLGLLQEAAGHLSEARDAYSQALKLDPNLETARLKLGALLPAGKR